MPLGIKVIFLLYKFILLNLLSMTCLTTNFFDNLLNYKIIYPLLVSTNSDMVLVCGHLNIENATI